MMVMKLLARRSFNAVTFPKRSLFNQDFLGLTAYKKKRDELLTKGKADTLLSKIKEVCEDPKKKVLSHDIKDAPYIVKTKDDADIFGKALEKYCNSLSPQSIVFQNFRTGPEIMRMYYLLNLPVEGMSLLQNPVTSSIFNDVKSYFIIQDLLYNNGLYSEVCELFRIVQDKQMHGRKIPFLNYIMFQAACYKMKTSDSYKEAMEVFEEFIEFYKKPTWPMVMYTMILALENGSPKLPLQYPLGKDIVSHNIRLAALIRSGDKTNALDYFKKLPKKSIVIQSIAEELCVNQTKSDSSSENSEISKENSFSNKTFDELAEETMHSLRSLKFNPN